MLWRVGRHGALQGVFKLLSFGPPPSVVFGLSGGIFHVAQLQRRWVGPLAFRLARLPEEGHVETLAHEHLDAAGHPAGEAQDGRAWLPRAGLTPQRHLRSRLGSTLQCVGEGAQR